jgi:hypothetical protein
MALSKLALVGVAFALTVGPASAQPALPQTCAAADVALAASIDRNGKAAPSNSESTDLWLGKGAGLAHQRAEAVKDATAQTRLTNLAHFCIGDLVAAERYGEAIREAAHFGMLEEADRIARIATALQASSPPAK